jgi:hypothetical protein
MEAIMLWSGKTSLHSAIILPILLLSVSAKPDEVK